MDNLDLSGIPIEDLPRYKAPNPYGYDELTLAKRELEIKAALKDFPTLDYFMVAMAWDVTNNLGEERMNEIIKNKEWDKKRTDRPKPGVYNTITID